MTRLSGRIVTPGGVVTGHLDLSGPAIAAIVPDDTAGDDVIVPGFIDLHCHGGGGHTFTTGDPAAARGAAAFHLSHGTTTLLASLVSSPFELMRSATLAYRPLVEQGVLAGIHFEGPYLSAVRCGAQNPAHLRNPVLAELTELIELGAGSVRMMTVAPELDGALDAIALLRDAGVLAAIGHTDASYAQTHAGVRAGATVATHLFNGMRPPHHREPGPVVGLLSSTATVELIADNIHLHPGMLAFAAHSAGPGRSILVTDAMDATGMPDGAYELGGQAVVVADRVARLAQGGAIAGSTLTMDLALRNAVAAGLPLTDAVAMSSTTPARLLGLTDRGALAPGLRADIVVLTADLRLKRVLRGGA
ncbi:N-acetylglucosamine-6-phosphate deacetylase [Actinoplanes teichomyceticus]|uniref:N-acetylglucosamine-6-phosphate deacetylase n=1 Tax=Actinoplanes teichomyceticus TaxID=1867 RepID=A0A561WQD8_ACTTI|nr:N-acetylglucosamine-6-phosphate deacetylase [Actinoplanes teichomyceticus]TWG26070.1 N-acetylglucosamine 6-phosphate deacetylase [Actinoplanes teichomyceticus]GIF11144.1 N-acetylglucosamine-6-phosphate deacetylase [Actinoplanes teichomyceticus]